MSRLRTRRNSKDSKTQKLTGLRKLEEKKQSVLLEISYEG
jgi:hypothetical protein